LIAYSPFHFAKQLPANQLPMGSEDEIVPVSQGHWLDQKWIKWGRAAIPSYLSTKETTPYIAANNTRMANRIEQFLSTL